ncbi:hypothetical protein [Streptomyces sp. NPDC045470]|uniref:hypothetical protein n=1 Tax=unclassified Streptomyces TaxID=2593676 RepID=UPI0033FCA258
MTGTRSQRVAGATAAAVLVTLAVTVTAGGNAPVAAVAGGVPAAGPELTLADTTDTYYLPRYRLPVRDDLPAEYRITLKAREPHVVKGVTVRIDLSVLAGLADVTWVDKGHRCAPAGQIITCALGDVEQGVAFTPFHLTPRQGAAPGPAGAMTTTVTSADAPTVRHTTQVIVGAPAPPPASTPTAGGEARPKAFRRAAVARTVRCVT